jgi:hypothetical protein
MPRMLRDFDLRDKIDIGGSAAPSGDAKNNAASAAFNHIGPSRTGTKGLLDPS